MVLGVEHGAPVEPLVRPDELLCDPFGFVNRWLRLMISIVIRPSPAAAVHAGKWSTPVPSTGATLTSAPEPCSTSVRPLPGPGAS